MNYSTLQNVENGTPSRLGIGKSFSYVLLRIKDGDRPGYFKGHGFPFRDICPCTEDACKNKKHSQGYANRVLLLMSIAFLLILPCTFCEKRSMRGKSEFMGRQYLIIYLKSRGSFMAFLLIGRKGKST